MNQVVALQPQRPTHYTAEQLALVKRTVAADTTNDEFSMFIEVCKRVGLDPFRRQVYCLVYSKNNPEKRRVSFITGIDGFRAVAARNRDYRPDDQEPAITYLDSLKHPETNPLGIERAVVRAFKLASNGEWHAVVGVAWWDEIAPIEEVWEYDPEVGKRRPSGKFKLGGNWSKMGRVMIAKAAEANALRKGWPEDLSGVYAPEEVARAELESNAAELVEDFEKEQRLKALNSGTKTILIQWSAGEPLAPIPLGKFMDQALSFLRNSTSVAQVNAWEEINRHSLKEFWAQHKGDAFELKRNIEERRKELEAQP